MFPLLVRNLISQLMLIHFADSTITKRGEPVMRHRSQIYFFFWIGWALFVGLVSQGG